MPEPIEGGDKRCWFPWGCGTKQAREQHGLAAVMMPAPQPPADVQGQHRARSAMRPQSPGERPSVHAVPNCTGAGGTQRAMAHEQSRQAGVRLRTLSLQSQVLHRVLLRQRHVGDGGRLQGEGHANASCEVALVDTRREDATRE